jgi:hypothetical protein
MRSHHLPARDAAFAITIVLTGCSMVGSAEPQRFKLYTHCGLNGSLIEFDGDFWQVVGPERLADDLGPPDGFGDPFDRGSIARTGLLTAVYVSSEDVRVDLVRLGERPDPPPCY